MRAQLKSVARARNGDDLQVVYDRRSQLVIGDPGGQVERLLELLRTGGGLVEDGDRRAGLSTAHALRHASNLGFFESVRLTGPQPGGDAACAHRRACARACKPLEALKIRRRTR